MTVKLKVSNAPNNLNLEIGEKAREILKETAERVNVEEGRLLSRIIHQWDTRVESMEVLLDEEARRVVQKVMAETENYCEEDVVVTIVKAYGRLRQEMHTKEVHSKITINKEEQSKEKEV